MVEARNQKEGLSKYNFGCLCPPVFLVMYLCITQSEILQTQILTMSLGCLNICTCHCLSVSGLYRNAGDLMVAHSCVWGKIQASLLCV